MQGVRFQSLVRELRYPMLCGVAKKKKKPTTTRNGGCWHIINQLHFFFFLISKLPPLIHPAVPYERVTDRQL